MLYAGGEAAKRQRKMYSAVENALGIRDWVEKQGHELFATSDKEW